MGVLDVPGGFVCGRGEGGLRRSGIVCKTISKCSMLVHNACPLYMVGSTRTLKVHLADQASVSFIDCTCFRVSVMCVLSEGLM